MWTITVTQIRIYKTLSGCRFSATAFLKKYTSLIRGSRSSFNKRNCLSFFYVISSAPISASAAILIPRQNPLQKACSLVKAKYSFLHSL